MKNLAIISIIFFLSACEQSQQAQHPAAKQHTETTEVKAINITGLWRGVLTSPGGELPFGIDISKDNNGYAAKILNGEERVAFKYKGLAVGLSIGL